MDEQGPREARNEEAWELYIEAERREVKMRREGHLAKMLGPALPGESPEELERLAEEDRRRAAEGLVELMNESGEITYMHIDDLAPPDRSARIRAEGKRIEWLGQRRGRKTRLRRGPGPPVDPAGR